MGAIIDLVKGRMLVPVAVGAFVLGIVVGIGIAG